MSSTSSFKLLFLGAGPADLPRFRQDKEFMAIRKRLHRTRFRDRVTIEFAQAVAAGDISEHVTEHSPQLLHISTHGYGASTNQLAFEDDDGLAQPVAGADLAELIGEFHDHVCCVVLCACFSLAQARAIAQHIPCVIGVAGEVEDAAAIRFAEQFYGALAAGKSVGHGFRLAKKSTRISRLDSEPFQLVTREGVEADQVFVGAGAMTRHNRHGGQAGHGAGDRQAGIATWTTAQVARWSAVALAPLLLVWGLYQLGAAAHRAREALIGLSEADFVYPVGELVRTGAAVLVRLAWYMIIGPIAGLGIERWAVVVLLVLLAVPVVLRWRGWPGWGLAWLAGALPVLGYGAILYANAVGIHRVALPGSVANWPCQLGPGIPQQIGFEVCSWLENASAVNAGRRLALAGLGGWWVVAAGLGMWLSLRLGRAWLRDRRPSAGAGVGPGLPALGWRWARWVVIGGYGVLLLWVLAQVPRAYAIANWALRYPRVVDIDPRCDADLADVVRVSSQERSAGADCRVLDVAAGAENETIVHHGHGCPGNERGALSSTTLRAGPGMEPGEKCIRHRADNEPILNRGE